MELEPFNGDKITRVPGDSARQKRTSRKMLARPDGATPSCRGGWRGGGGSCSRKQKGEVRASENEAERKLDSLGVIVPIKVQLEWKSGIFHKRILWWAALCRLRLLKSSVGSRIGEGKHTDAGEMTFVPGWGRGINQGSVYHRCSCRGSPGGQNARKWDRDQKSKCSSSGHTGNVLF